MSSELAAALAAFGIGIVAGLRSMVCGAALGVSAKHLIVQTALLGGLGAVNGAFGGFHVRRLLVKYFKIPDLVIALAEDALAIAGGLFIVSRF